MLLTPEQFNEAYNKLPITLREYIAEDDLTAITEQVGKEHNLHVDTIGALYREATNMLLGIINPTQFVGELKSVGVPEESIGAIVQELNEKVFIPLREKMKNQLPEPGEEDEGEAEQQSTPTPVELVSTPATYVPPAAPIAPSFVEPDPAFVQQPPQPAAPASFAPPAPAYAPPVPAPQPSVYTPSVPMMPVTPPTPIPVPHARTMQEDMAEVKAMREHNPQKYSLRQEQPVVQQAAMPQTPPMYAPATPIASVPPISNSPITPTATPAMQPQRNSQPAPSSVTTQSTPQAQQSDNRDALHAVLKSYGIDPYREPPE